MLPVDRVEMQPKPVLKDRAWQGDPGAEGDEEGDTGTPGHTFRQARWPMLVWATTCPSGPTARWERTAGGELSPGGRRERMKSPRRMVWMMMVPSCGAKGWQGDDGGPCPPCCPPHPPQLTLEPDTAMSSSVLMATQVTSASWPYRTWAGLGAKPLENPP